MKPTLSLYTKTLTLVSLVTIGMFALLGSSHMFQEHEEYNQALRNKAALQTRLLSTDLAQPLWDFNIRYIDASLDTLVKDEDIAAVRIVDASGKVTHIKEVRGTFIDAYTGDYFLERSQIVFILNGVPQNLGYVEVLWSLKAVMHEFGVYLREMIVMMCLFTLMQLLLNFLILRHVLGPVRSITHSMQELAEGKTDTIIPSQTRNDEIGRMARAIQVFKDKAEHNEQLQREVDIRRQLYRELEEAKQKAEAANAAKSQFLANISHEIRTPMNGIVGMAHLLADTNASPEQRDYISTIHRSARNLLVLINDVLDLSKIEAGDLELEETAFDPVELFTHAYSLLSPMAREKQIDIRLMIDPSMPRRILGDPGCFTQVVTNLISNAIKFTEVGHVEAALAYDPQQASLRCDIRDTGIGIPAAKQPIIFEKFVQGDAAITRKYGGSGLGLTITHQLVTMMKGTIEFESSEQGTHFWFTLPAPPAPADMPESEAVAVSRAQLPASEARLLVAEDHPVNQLIVTKLLHKLGFTDIDTAENGAVAVAKTERQAYHLVLMDCQMPEMDGYEATRRIRRREIEEGENTHVPIVAMTANAIAGDREKCLRAGMDEYLSKPIDPSKLGAVLSEWFALMGSATPANRTAGKAMPIDRQRLKLTATTPEEEQEVLALFFRLAEEKLNTMKNARRSNERTHWKSAAHYLKGSAANIGLIPLSEACRTAELHTDADYQQHTAMLQAIEHEFERAREFAKTM